LKLRSEPRNKEEQRIEINPSRERGIKKKSHRDLKNKTSTRTSIPPKKITTTISSLSFLLPEK